MKPIDALREIATLLERERASRYRSAAFRRAAAAIEDLSDDELRMTRASAGARASGTRRSE
jgi:putative hydrolase